MDEDSPSLAWFFEGFSAEYAAWTSRFRLGEIDGETFLAELVKQFMLGLADGPVAFHYDAPDYEEQLLGKKPG